MTNEEFEKQKHFILNQQAQFSADIIELNSGISELKDIVTRLAKATLNRLEDTDQRISALVDSQMRLQDSQAKLSEAQGRTDEHLRNLIAVVDRNLQGRNGSSTA